MGKLPIIHILLGDINKEKHVNTLKIFLTQFDAHGDLSSVMLSFKKSADVPCRR